MELDGVARCSGRRGQAADAGAQHAESEDVSVDKKPPTDRSAVDPGAVRRQPKILDVHVDAAAMDLCVQPRHDWVVQHDVQSGVAADGHHRVNELADCARVVHLREGR